MKLKNILKEEDDPIEFINAIKRDCQPFFQQSNGKPLYRGITKIDAKFGKKQVRKNRKALKADKIFPNFFKTIDDSMKKDGFKAHRSNSILCTGNTRLGNSYGKNCLIFPIGDFQFSWSTKIKDYLDDYITNFYNKGNKISAYEYWDEIKQTYKNNNLEQAIKSKNEILITCEEYYYLDSYYYENLKIN